MLSPIRGLACAAMLCALSSHSFAEYGRTAGTFGVTGGSATYTIPIWTPPGPNGVTPNIALTYNSSSANGVGGVGWHLSAVSSIERCNRTANQDSSAAPIDLSMSDKFCIGGNRLRLVSGTYGASGSVYFTELADFSRITAYGVAGNGPDHFLVEAKDGLKYEYGNVANARVALGATVLRWMLNRVYDRNGNNYVVSYINANGFALPDVISWTPTFQGSTSYLYEAKFNYWTSRTDEDSFIGKVAGFDVSNRNRLESVQIKSAGVVKRKYRFTYDISSATSRSRLTSAKECADDAESNCLLPISFTYQAGLTGISSNAAPGLSSSSSLARGKYDFNGDGKSDLLYIAGANWHVSFSTGTGFGAGVNTGVSSSSIPLAHRFLASHQDGLLTSQGGIWHYVGFNGTVFTTQSTGVSGSSGILTDNNGDGLADLVWTSGGNVMLRLNTTAAGATVPSFGSAVTAISFNVGQGNVSIIGAQNCPVDRICDINGDGRGDMIVNVTSVTNCGFSGCTIVNNYYDLIAYSGGYTSGALTGPIGYTGIKFNDDRCIDRIPNFQAQMQVSGCNSGSPLVLSLPSTPILVLDWNGDGNGDILVNNGGFFGVYLARSGSASPFSSLISTAIPYSSSCNYFAFDADGDTFDDIACVATTSPFNVSYFTHNGSGGVYLTQQPDLLSSATNGYGVYFSPSYVSTSQNNYTRGTGTQLPLVDATDPITVVAQVVASDGVGGSYTRTFSYHGARYSTARSQFAGFQRIDEVDSRNGLISRAYFDQAFPNIGMVNRYELVQPNGATTISRVLNTNTAAVLDGTASNQRYFAYTAGSVATRYEVGGSLNGVLLSTVTVTNSFETTGGTLYDQTVVTDEPGSGANGITGGGSWTNRTHFPLANLVNDTANWCLGRPGRSEITRYHNLSYGSSVTRTSTVGWNSAFCRPTQIVDEPGNGSLQVVTDLGYDGFGNVSSTTVTGVGMAARQTTTAYANSTFQTGQFPLTVTNPLGQISVTSWNYDLAVPTSATTPNGLYTTWVYDSYGRRIQEYRPDSTYTTWDHLQCTSCDSRVRIYVDRNDRTAGGISYRRSIDYFDQFERSIYEYELRNDGYYNRSTRYFDALGRVVREYFPVSNAGNDVGYTSFSYDLLGRTYSVSRPRSDVDPTPQATTLNYAGLSVYVTDPQGKVTTRGLDARGVTRFTRDHDNYSQTFDYDAFDNLTRVSDSAGNTLQTTTYNIRGMPTGRVDMDLGSWSFTPNALGDAVSQTDAKGQTTTFQFDLLGRLTQRTEAEGTSIWTWGTSSAARNIGDLASMSGPGYLETYTYDSIGRPSTTTISADTTYQIDYSYNTIGALDTLTYPTSTSSYRLKLQYEYQNGHLTRIKDFHAPATVFWTANAFSGRNKVTQETLGNGLVTNRAYDSVTGWLKTIQTGIGGGTGIQNLAYEWDLVGNLKKRRDLNQSNLTEEFFYDNIYRLDYSQLNGVTNLDMAYDAMGNITSKSDVGSYSYHPTKKHQVTSTSNGWSFSYDNNGNMTSGRNATITWTSYNYPASIANGLDSSVFSYTPNRRYWRQISNYTNGGTATTIYVGNLLEKVTTSAGTDYRHLIRAGGSTITVSRQSSGTNSTHYVTRDHLGSSSAITNSSGGVLVNASFDAFGKRRGSTWSGNVSAGDWSAIASTTRRGYTDHTMLDNLSLIHMNGRVQDPVLGRFLSADPLVTDPLRTQNYNRYSYVYNNPLRSTDPSGFDECDNGSGSTDESDSDDKPGGNGYQNGSTTASGMADCMQEVEVVGRNPPAQPSRGPEPPRQDPHRNPPDLPPNTHGPGASGDTGDKESEEDKPCPENESTEAEDGDVERLRDVADANGKVLDAAGLVADHASRKSTDVWQRNRYDYASARASIASKGMSAIEMTANYQLMVNAFRSKDMYGAIKNGTDMLINGLTSMMPGVVGLTAEVSCEVADCSGQVAKETAPLAQHFADGNTLSASSIMARLQAEAWAKAQEGCKKPGR